jgi:hypothetical protein
MRKLLVYTLPLYVFAVGCSSSPKYTDVSKYNLRPDALEDGEQIKIIAGVIGNKSRRDEVFYNVLVAVSQRTGDTINILIDVDPAVRESDTATVYNYIAPTNMAYKMLKNSINEEKGKIVSTPKHVVYIQASDEVVDMSNPTVIGMIGTIGTMEK